MEISELATQINDLKNDSLRTHQAVLADAHALVGRMRDWLDALCTLVPGALVTQADTPLMGDHRGAQVLVKTLELHVPLGNGAVGKLKIAPMEVGQTGTFLLTSNRGGSGTSELFLRRVAGNRWCVTKQPNNGASSYVAFPPLDQPLFNDAVYELMRRQ